MRDGAGYETVVFETVPHGYGISYDGWMGVSWRTVGRREGELNDEIKMVAWLNEDEHPFHDLYGGDRWKDLWENFDWWLDGARKFGGKHRLTEFVNGLFLLYGWGGWMISYEEIRDCLFEHHKLGLI